MRWTAIIYLPLQSQNSMKSRAVRGKYPWFRNRKGLSRLHCVVIATSIITVSTLTRLPICFPWPHTVSQSQSTWSASKCVSGHAHSHNREDRKKPAQKKPKGQENSTRPQSAGNWTPNSGLPPPLPCTCAILAPVIPKFHSSTETTHFLNEYNVYYCTIKLVLYFIINNQIIIAISVMCLMYGEEF